MVWPFSSTRLSRTWMVSPPTAMIRLMKSRVSSFGYLNTTMSPCRGSRSPGRCRSDTGISAPKRNLFTRMESPISSVSIMEPEGIVKACTANWRMKRARSTAMMMASEYSRKRDLRRGRATGGAAPVSRSGRTWRSFMRGRSALEHRQERFLRHLDLADLFHPLLAFLLLLEQLTLAGDVAAVTLGGDVLAHGLDRLAGDDPAADRGLDRDLVELAGDHRPQLLGEGLALLVGLLAVDDDGEGVHRVPVEQDVELDHVGGAELQEVVVEGGVTLGDGLEPVVEVHHDLAQREVELDVDPLAHVLERLVLAPFLLGELVDLAHELGGHEDRAAYVGLLDALDLVGRGQLGRVLHVDDLALHGHHPEADAGRGDDEGEIELALEPLLHDLEVEHAEEAAAEPVAERERGLRLEVERRIVQAQLLQRVAETLVVGVLDRVQPREDHGLGVAVPGAG